MRDLWAAFVVVIFISGFVQGVRAEDDIRGSAYLTYRSTETETEDEDDDESKWQFIQIYDLGLTKALTSKVEFNADVGVNLTDAHEDKEKTTRPTLDLRLDTRNEYFDANTGYQIAERGLDILNVSPDDKDRRTTKLWNANFVTKSEKYPVLRLRYNENKDYDHLAVHEEDTKTTELFGSADYTLRFLNLYYDYRHNVSDNYVEGSTQKSDTYDGRVDFRKSFWDNRVTTSGNYFINNRKTKTTIREAGGHVDEKRRAIAGLYKHDTNPPLTELEPLPALIDGNKERSTGVNIGGGSRYWKQNIGADLNFATQVYKIYLYTTEPDSQFGEDNFIWDVYSSGDNWNWTQITDGVGFDYNTLEKRFEISFASTTARYFKVVDRENDQKDLYVTEIEAFGFTTEGTEKFTAQTIQAYLGVKPVDWLCFTYDFTQDKQDIDPGSDQTRKTHNVSGRVERELHKYLLAWAQYRRQWQYESEAEDRTTDMYLLHFFSSPLETIDTDLSFNHTVIKKESRTHSKTSSALFQIAARLLEGADLDINANIIRSDNLEAESETTTKSIDSNLRLELTRKLTAEIDYDWNWTETQEPSGDTTGRTWNSKVTFYWRPSHDFFFSASCGIDKDEEAGDKTFEQRYNMSWLITEKIELDMGYTRDANDTVQSNYSSDLTWDLSRILTLRFRYNWSRQEEDTVTETQTFTTDLSAVF